MTTRLQYRNEIAHVSNIGGVIQVEGSTWRARKWATKQMKRIAATFGISLKRRNGAWYADSQKMASAEYRFHEALKKCWVSPRVRDMKGKILDKGF